MCNDTEQKNRDDTDGRKVLLDIFSDEFKNEIGASQRFSGDIAIMNKKIPIGYIIDPKSYQFFLKCADDAEDKYFSARLSALNLSEELENSTSFDDIEKELNN